MAELTIEEARKIYASSDEMKSLMLTKFTKEALDGVNGNLTHMKFSDGSESWYTPTGRWLHCKHPDGREEWYDGKGNMIHEKAASGYEKWHDFDTNRKLIHEKDSDGYEDWYDANGGMSHKTASTGTICWYDVNGKVIRKKYSNGADDSLAYRQHFEVTI